MRKRISCKPDSPSSLGQTHRRRRCVQPTWERLLLSSDRAAWSRIGSPDKAESQKELKGYFQKEINQQ